MVLGSFAIAADSMGSFAWIVIAFLRPTFFADEERLEAREAERDSPCMLLPLADMLER